MRAPVTRRLGLLALACYAAHAVDIVVHYPAANLLWSCNVASLAVALGLLVESALPVAAGALMLLLGDPLWLIDLAGGGELMVTAPLTHFGVLALALVGMRRLGMPRATFAIATLAIGAATGIARLLGPPGENVNLAFAVPRGWEARFPSHGVYLIYLGAGLAVAALALQLLLRRLGFRVAPRAGEKDA